MRLADTLRRINTGKGTLSAFLNDDSIYRETKSLLKELRESVEGPANLNSPVWLTDMNFNCGRAEFADSQEFVPPSWLYFPRNPEKTSARLPVNNPDLPPVLSGSKGGTS